MFANKYFVMLIFATSLAVEKFPCKKHWNTMCCIADYDLIIPTTGCEKCTLPLLQDLANFTPRRPPQLHARRPQW